MKWIFDDTFTKYFSTRPLARLPHRLTSYADSFIGFISSSSSSKEKVVPTFPNGNKHLKNNQNNILQIFEKSIIFAVTVNDRWNECTRYNQWTNANITDIRYCFFEIWNIGCAYEYWSNHSSIILVIIRTVGWRSKIIEILISVQKLRNNRMV